MADPGPRLTPQPFLEAIAWAKARGVVLPDVYYGELQGLARAMAFSIAGITKLDQLQGVLDSLVQAMEAGSTLGEWQDRVRAGDIALDLPQHRLENIFRTNLQGHYNRGRCEQQRTTLDTRPWFLYDAVNDSRTRPAHAAMDGFVARHDDPIWRTWTPPAGYQSLLPDQAFLGAVETGLKAWYSGPAVEVIMDSGARFRVTAKHPVLTRSGWVDACALRKGDSLLCYRAPTDVRETAIATDGKKQDVPLTAEQAFDAMAAGGVVPMPRAAFNLNGDVQFFQSDVHVVTANSELRNSLHAGILEMLQELGLKETSATHVVLPSSGSIHPGPLASVRVRPEFLSFARRLYGDALDSVASDGSFPGFLCVEFDPVRFQECGDPFSINAVVEGEDLQRDTRLIVRNTATWNRNAKFSSRLPLANGPEKGGLLISGSLDAGFRDVFIGGFMVNPDAAGHIRDTHPGLVEVDNVVDTVLFDYRGHVFDFQCSNGLIIAYGGVQIYPILSNCRCRRIALTVAQAEQFRAADARRLAKDPDLAQARASAQPDPGWDYSVCEDPTEGVRQAIRARSVRHDRAITPKLADLAPDVAMPIEAAAAAARDDCLIWGRAHNRERLIILDEATGKELARADGVIDGVNLTDSMLALISRSDRAARLVHNHPGDSSLSLEDIMLLANPGAACVEAIGHGGSLYRAFGPIPVSLKPAWDAANNAVYEVFSRAVSSGALGIPEANTLHHYVMARALNAANIVRYEAILSGEKLLMVDRLRQFIDAALDAATKAALKAAHP